MASINKVILIGNLGKDPETRAMPNGDYVANVTLATSESWKDKAGEKQEKTEWHRVVFYRKVAEIVDKYLKKGSKIYLEGKLQTRKWEKDGVTHYATEVIAHDMKMLSGSKPKSEEKKPAKSGSFGDMDDDIPF